MTVIEIATVVGGVAGVWYLFEKFCAIPWRRPTYWRKSATPAAIPPELETPTAPLDQDSWPFGTEPRFPTEVAEAVNRHFPNFRLPGAKDIYGDWARYGGPETLSPFFCSGSFTGDRTEYALFILSRTDTTHKVIALVRESADRQLQLLPYELSSGSDSPHAMFLRIVRPGRYRPGPSAKKLGSTKVVRLKREGINLGMFEGADSLLYWDKRRKSFAQVWMSD